jgi:sugar phosphate isomerase/epimerase
LKTKEEKAWTGMAVSLRQAQRSLDEAIEAFEDLGVKVELNTNEDDWPPAYRLLQDRAEALIALGLVEFGYLHSLPSERREARRIVATPNLDELALDRSFLEGLMGANVLVAVMRRAMATKRAPISGAHTRNWVEFSDFIKPVLT